jgi:membrane protease subunit (stomatin/prohibitin family)
LAVIDRVKWDGSPNILSWKFPSQELSTWTQLIVNETQEAYVVHGGVYDGPFGAGRHTLETENLPVIRNLLGIPFGGKSPFAAEVWFVNKSVNVKINWGTPDPIQLEDPKYKIFIPVRAFGQYWVRISDSKRFLMQLVGTLKGFEVGTLQDFLSGILTAQIKQAIADLVIKNEIPVLEMSTRIEELSNNLRSTLTKNVQEYGIEITQFNFESINVPEDDPAVISLKAALAKRAELGILNLTYQQDRSLDILQTAAGNEGSAGSVLGAGIGFGLGAGLGGPMAAGMSGAASVFNTNGNQSGPVESNSAESIRLLKELADLKTQGFLTEEEFTEAKRKIIGT